MCSLSRPAGHITAEGNITREAHITFPKGTHRSKKPITCVIGFFVAAEEGFEPSQTESESVVLPLHNSAIFNFTFLFEYTAQGGKYILNAGFAFRCKNRNATKIKSNGDP